MLFPACAAAYRLGQIHPTIGEAMSKSRIESKFVTVAPGVQIHVLDGGAEDAPALVFLPGLTFSGEVFRYQLEHFADKYRVVAVDPPAARGSRP